jgi:Fe-S-cluster containining protein
MPIIKDCSKCSKCCEAIYLPYPEDSEDIKRWIKYHDIEFVKNSKGTFIKIHNKCSKLKDGKCSIYEDRPEICKIFNCEEFKEFF